MADRPIPPSSYSNTDVLRLVAENETPNLAFVVVVWHIYVLSDGMKMAFGPANRAMFQDLIERGYLREVAPDAYRVTEAGHTFLDGLVH